MVGRAGLEKIMKAMKKTRKATTVSSHSEAAASGETPSPAPAPAPAPEPEPSPPPAEAPPAEPPAPPPSNPPPPEKPAEEAKPAAEAAAPPPPPEVKDPPGDGVQMIHHYPHQHILRSHWSDQPPAYGYDHIIHSYNRYRPAAGIFEYADLRSPPVSIRYLDDYYRHHHGGGGGGGSNEGATISYHPHQNNITSIFSDENPNACSVM